MIMKKSLKKQEVVGNPCRWALWMIIIGCVYIVLDPIERYMVEYRAMHLLGYKATLDTAKDYTFALASIIGGVFLLRRDNRSWLFISYSSLGFLITLVMHIIISGYLQRCNSLDQFLLIQIWSVAVLIHFWKKLFKSPQVYIVLLLIVIQNLSLVFLYRF